GDVQWMTSGSGIIHSEGPSEAFAQEGGEMELIQLWVNLPRDHKLTAPKYQDIKGATMPVIEEGGFSWKVVAGEYGGTKGPATTFSPLLALMGSFKAGAEITISLADSYNVLVYILEGTIEAGNEIFDRLNLAVFKKDGEGIHLKAKSDGRLLFLAGEPLQEPMVSYGPFVMNYPGELKQAVMDYEMGKMGALEG
ncbi:MAG: pirin family protein, partial [Flaviaesturariibacter sp.]|nr:pirin family protein [Flaviaesturariibacter sp.]